MATEDARKLFVAGLSESISEDVLRQVFEATGGKVVDVSMPRDRATGRPRGFGFVTFATAEDASKARDKLDGSLQAGRPISVRPFSSEPPRRDARAPGEAPSPQQSDDRTLYVGNLPYDITQQELTQLFADNGAGPVARIHLPIGPDGRPRGFGFVAMPSAEAANQALATLRNFEVRGRKLMLNIAHPRGAGGGPGGGGGAGPRPPRRDEGYGGGSYPPMPPSGMEFGGRPVEGRRARPPPTGAPGGTDWDDKKRKKARGAAKSAEDPPKKGRGGGGTWQAWADDWDDDDRES
ncbi:MAG TPA: hypothetical protein VGI10_12350 [Polyangiaceae bacterium]